METIRQWDNIYKVLKKTFNQELFFKCEDEIKILPDKQIERIMTRGLTLQEMLKGVLQAEMRPET